MNNQKYLEHEKLKNISDKAELCGDFLEWLQTKYFMIDKEGNHEGLYFQLGYSSYINFEKLLAEFFNIDTDELEKEKRLMLEELRRK